MTLNQRRALYLAFIFLFAAITPLAWLYASGYKLGSGFKFEKTGILIIDSKPQGATIFLDGKPFGRPLAGLFPGLHGAAATPYKAKGLRAGEYLVGVELDGYWPWSKRLRVSSGESTFAEDIVLFRNESPLLLSAGNFTAIAAAPDRNLALASGPDKTAMIDIGASRIIAEKEGRADGYYRFSPDSRRLTDGERIYSARTLEPSAELPEIFREIKEPLVWLDSGRIFGRRGRDLAGYSLSSGRAELFPQAAELSGLGAGANRLYAIMEAAGNSILVEIDPDTGASRQEISLPLSEYGFLGQSPSFLEIYDARRGLLHLIDPADAYKPLFGTFAAAAKTDWINSRQFVHTDGREVWLTDLEHSQNALIARYGREIRSIFWHPSRNYIIFSTGDYIATLELDKRDKYNFTRLASGQGIDNVVLSKDGGRLLFSGTVDGVTGAFVMLIQ